MAQVARQSRLLALFVCAGALCAVPAYAQDAIEPEVEALIAPSQQTETGVALARRQIQENDLLGAVGTLERVLFVDPEATGARLLYASLMCRLDDPAGAQVELGYLRGKDVDDAAWAEVVAACGNLPRPRAEAGQTSGAGE